MTPFPQEIIGLVAEHVSESSPSDLVNLLIVSSVVHVETERFFYRTIRLHTYNPETLDALLDRLSFTPRQALHVQALDLSFTTPISGPTQAKLTTALQWLHNLRDLRLRISGVHLLDPTLGCKFKLHRFEYAGEAAQVAASLGDILLHQPLIRHLSVPMCREALPVDLVPLLEILECPAYLAIALNIKRRPIKRLFWKSGLDAFQKMSRGSYLALIVLVLDDQYPYEYDLPTHCPNLRLLECDIISEDVDELEQLTESIKGLRYLHTLRANVSRHGLPSGQAGEITATSDSLMNVMASLKLVQIGKLQRKRSGNLEARQVDLSWYEWAEEV